MWSVDLNTSVLTLGSLCLSYCVQVLKGVEGGGDKLPGKQDLDQCKGKGMKIPVGEVNEQVVCLARSRG